MGLDLLIREQKNFRTNEKGNTVWEVEQLCNLRNCWNLLESLGLENCSTKSFYEKDLFSFIQDIEDENETRFILEELESVGITGKNDRTFEIHVWY